MADDGRIMKWAFFFLKLDIINVINNNCVVGYLEVHSALNNRSVWCFLGEKGQIPTTHFLEQLVSSKDGSTNKTRCKISKINVYLVIIKSIQDTIAWLVLWQALCWGMYKVKQEYSNIYTQIVLLNFVSISHRVYNLNLDAKWNPRGR